ncbi:MAG: UMP kinase [Gammaproteobacteria bacterium]|nr:UMP kinase [Gammaproteobacteria bacterium]MCH9744039.1 UMP kinase [Gammaproteobacteria bacterium]
MAGKNQPIYKRILLKMSGEALMGKGPHAIEPAVLDRMTAEIAEIRSLGIEVAIVIGGGNFFRGEALSKAGINRITGDHMGMLATLMNALAFRDSFERSNLPVRVLSAIEMGGVIDRFNLRKAIHHLESGRVVIFAAGTGTPLFTTDSAASLRGIEIGADVILKATNVDGVYSEDPAKNPDAKLYKHLKFSEALDKELAVMDLAAFCQARDHGMPLRVFNINNPGALLRVVTDATEGTLVD